VLRKQAIHPALPTSLQRILPLSYGGNCPQWKRFQDAEDITKNMTAELNDVPFEAFLTFYKRFKGYNKCIKVYGDYFE
jgi:hypothetical protein